MPAPRICCGWATRRSAPPLRRWWSSRGRGKGLIKDVGLGFLVTLGNPKAILFYSALLPTFLDMTAIRFADFLVLAGIVVVISYLVYGGYIFLAERSRRLLASSKASRLFNRLTGSILVGAGVAVAAR